MWTDSVYAALHPPRRRRAPLPASLPDAEAFAPGAPNIRPIVERAQLAPTNQLNVRVSHFASVAADLLLSGLVRQLDGSFVAIGPNGSGFLFSSVADRAVKTKDFSLGFGSGATLYSLNLSCLTAGVSDGQVFSVVQSTVLLPDSSSLPIQTVIGNYVTSTIPATWPGGQIIRSIEGPGFIRTIIGTDPPAGTNFSEVVPAGARWDLLSLQAQYTTAAGGGNRLVQLETRDGATTFGDFDTGAVQAPSTVVIYTWAVGTSRTGLIAGATTYALGSFPTDLPLRAGNSIVGSVSGNLPGDDWTAPVYRVREHLEA